MLLYASYYMHGTIGAHAYPYKQEVSDIFSVTHSSDSHYIVYSLNSHSFQPFCCLQLQEGRGNLFVITTVCLIRLICTWQSRMQSIYLFSFRSWYIQL